MKAIAVFLAIVTLSALGAAQHMIGVFPDSWDVEMSPQLQRLLGASYEFESVGGPSPFHLDAETLLVELLPARVKPGEWSSKIDHFVPASRRLIKSLRASCQPQRTIVVIPKMGSAEPSFFVEEAVPLMKQVARESGSEIVDLNDPAFNSGDLATDEANKLFVTLVDVEHNPRSWKVVRATSEQADEGPAKNAIDNNPDTYWHTRYNPNPTKVPHEIVVDLGQDETLDGFSYLARQDGGVNGRVKDFEFYLSEDPNNWTAPVLKGTLQNSMNEQRLLFEHPVKGRYFRFRALSEVNGNIWTSIAELGVIRSAYPR